ncbi:MAG: AsmA family protein, partial [Alphaproteobacteria bacterium]|nr:AsmA family protein [Alphaproteobacteria bacterium]
MGVALKKLVFGVIGVVGLITTGLLVLPIFVNFNQYKTEIQEAAKSAIGRDVSILGDVKLSLLPSPTIQIMNVRIANIAGASHPDMVLVDRLEASLAVLPLFKRHLEFRKISFVRPRFFLEELSSGEKNWTFKADEDSNQSAPPLTSGDKGSSSSMVMPTKIDIQKIKILNASVSFQKDKTHYEIADMDLDVKRQDSEVFEAEGRVDYKGKTIKLSGTIDLREPSLKYVVDVRLDGSALTLRGDYDLQTQAVTTAINLSLRPYDFSYLNDYLQSLPLHLDKHVFVKAEVSGTPDALKFKNIHYDSDALTFKGKASFDLRTQEIMLALNDLPGEAVIEGTLNMKGPLSGQVAVRAEDPSKFLKSLMKESDFGQMMAGANDDVLKKLKQSMFKASFEYADDAVVVKNLFITVKNAIVRGSCAVNMKGNTKAVKFDLAGQSLSDIFAIFADNALKTVNEGRLKGSVDLSEKSSHVDVEATLLGGTVALKGQLKPLKMNASLSHANLSHLLKVITKKPNSLKLGEAKIAADISHTDPILLISNLSGVIKSSGIPMNVGGDLKVHMLKTSTGVEGSLKLGKIDLGFLGAEDKSNSDEKSSKNETKGEAKKLSKKEPVKEKIEEKKSTKGNWSKEPLIPEGGALSLSLDVSVERLVSGDLMVEESLMQFQLKNGTFEIPTFTGRIFGGMIKGSASLGNGKALLNVLLQDAQLDRNRKVRWQSRTGIPDQYIA